MLEAQKQVVTNALAGVPRMTFDNNNTAPRAYLNYIFFDKNFGYVQTASGFDQITTNADTAFEKLELQTVIEQEGYLYIYVANESSADINVFFDDLKVTQVESRKVPYRLLSFRFDHCGVEWGECGHES